LSTAITGSGSTFGEDEWSDIGLAFALAADYRPMSRHWIIRRNFLSSAASRGARTERFGRRDPAATVANMEGGWWINVK
jgi:hypothetical protein